MFPCTPSEQSVIELEGGTLSLASLKQIVREYNHAITTSSPLHLSHGSGQHCYIPLSTASDTSSAISHYNNYKGVDPLLTVEDILTFQYIPMSVYIHDTIIIMLEVSKQQVCMSVSCMLHTFCYIIIYNIIVAVPMHAVLQLLRTFQ